VDLPTIAGSREITSPSLTLNGLPFSIFLRNVARFLSAPPGVSAETGFSKRAGVPLGTLVSRIPFCSSERQWKGDYGGDELVLPVALRKVDRGGHEDHRTVGVIELETVAIDEADGGVRTKQRNGEHFQEVTTDLKGRLDLLLDFGVRAKSLHPSPHPGTLVNSRFV
jgi:hypothetical protein